MARVIVVFGATGSQGGGVAKALLKDKRFQVRCVTRNTESPKAQALASLGAEIVQASLDDPDTLPGVLSGCHGVFGVTSYEFNAERETKQGKALVDACKAAGVQHLVFSLLESVEDAMGIKVEHFDSKGEVEKYMFASGIPCTSVRYSFYMENLLGMTKPQKQFNGEYTMIIPMESTPMDMIHCAGAGTTIAAIFRCPANYLGKAIGLSGDKMTIPEYAKILNKHLAPKKFKASDMSPASYAKLGFTGSYEMAAMFEYYIKGNPDRNQRVTYHLNPGTLSFEGWVKANKDTIIAALDETWQ